jgi:hypothetical protein
MWLWMSLVAIGWSIIVNLVMEAYHQRRASEQMGEYER